MSLSDIKADLKLVEDLFNEDRLIEAMENLKNINFHVNRLENNEEMKAVRILMQSSPACQKILESGKKTDKYLELIDTDDSWNVWNNEIGFNKNVKVSIHKDTQRDGHYQFKIESMIHNCKMEHVIAALMENDLYPCFMPLCSKSECYKVLSPSRRCIRSEFDFVLFQRESFLSVQSDVLPGGDGVLLQFSPLTKDEEAAMDISRADSTDEEDANSPIDPAIKRQFEALTREIYQDEISKMLKTKSTLKQSPVSGVDKQAIPGVTPQHSMPRLFLDGAIVVKEKKTKAKNPPAESPLLDVYDESKEAYTQRPSMRSLSTKDPGFSESKSSAGSDKGSAVTAIHRPPRRQSVQSVAKNTFLDSSSCITVTAVVSIDPNISHTPDWIFSMALRSSACMFLPLLEHQSKLFVEGREFHGRLHKNKKVYAVVAERMMSAKKIAKEKREKKKSRSSEAV